jgi:translation initiation factor IF-2
VGSIPGTTQSARAQAVLEKREANRSPARRRCRQAHPGGQSALRSSRAPHGVLLAAARAGEGVRAPARATDLGGGGAGRGGPGGGGASPRPAPPGGCRPHRGAATPAAGQDGAGGGETRAALLRFVAGPGGGRRGAGRDALTGPRAVRRGPARALRDSDQRREWRADVREPAGAGGAGRGRR